MDNQHESPHPISRAVRSAAHVVASAATSPCHACSIRAAPPSWARTANKYDAPFDQHIINVLGLDPAALLKQLAAGKGDAEILQWVGANGQHQLALWEIEQWSEYMLRRTPDSDEETLILFFREDVKTWMDLIDLDDHVTFGGKA
jgi:hypothetical protein